jgi:xylulose-5-phosphate/fructose-6-phosphate phosphoketolase
MGYIQQTVRNKLLEHREYINCCGDDMPEITGWKWKAKPPTTRRGRSVTQRKKDTAADNV